jgi:hypothetical protein
VYFVIPPYRFEHFGKQRFKKTKEEKNDDVKPQYLLEIELV